MTGTIKLALVDGFSPPWGADLVDAIADVFPGYPPSLTRVELGVDRYLASERRQYNATLILAGLLRHLPDESSKIVGVTDVDLFIPVLTFVFGQAQLDGPGAVISAFRLRNEFYGLPADEGLLFERSVKEVVHELGHTFGLVHCDDYRCVMHASTYVEDVDVKAASFCRGCAGLLAALAQ